MEVNELLKAMMLVAEMEKKQEKCKSSSKQKQVVVIRTTTKVMFIGESMTGAKLAKFLKEEKND